MGIWKPTVSCHSPDYTPSFAARASNMMRLLNFSVIPVLTSMSRFWKSDSSHFTSCHHRHIHLSDYILSTDLSLSSKSSSRSLDINARSFRYGVMQRHPFVLLSASVFTRPGVYNVFQVAMNSYCSLLTTGIWDFEHAYLPFTHPNNTGVEDKHSNMPCQRYVHWGMRGRKSINQRFLFFVSLRTCPCTWYTFIL